MYSRQSTGAEVFFAEGDWAIEQVDPKRWWNHWSAISHDCQKRKWLFNNKQVLLPMITINLTKCPKCDEPVPDGIKGLWTMHNWDNIQEQEGRFYR